VLNYDNQNFTFAPNDSILLTYLTTATDGQDSLRTLMVEPHLRIRLKDEFGQRILDQGGTSSLEVDNFTNYLKGLLIKSDKDNESMANFNLQTGRSRVSFYYSNDEQNGNFFSLTINDTTAIVSNYQTDFSGSAIEAQMQNPAPNSQELMYLQSVNSTGVKLEFPFLEELGKENTVINKVELLVTMFDLEDTTTTSTNSLPPQLILFTINNDSASYDLSHTYLTTDIDTLEGENGRLYQFTFGVSNFDGSLSTYFQALLDEKFVDNGLDASNRSTVMFVRPSTSTGYRAVIAGPEHPDYPMKMKVLYTPLTE